MRAPDTTTLPTQSTDDPDCTSQEWACSHVESGIDDGYLPEDYNPDADTSIAELEQILADYGALNPGFDAASAIAGLPERDSARRGDMFIALAIGIGIVSDPGIDPMDVAADLADMGVLLGHDGNGDGKTNPYIRADADPDSTMNNAQLAAFLDRLDVASSPGSSRGGPARDPAPGAGGRPVDPRCKTGLRLSSSERNAFAAQLHWSTLVTIDSQGRPGRPWPPHPDLPGGSEHLVVSRSPVWPVLDPAASWSVVSADGCLWRAVSVESRLTLLLPWNARHRSLIEEAGEARPYVGFATYLSRWYNLSAAQRDQAEERHRDRDVNAVCDIASAMTAADSYDRCRWELETPGVWSWQARACFEGVAGTTTHRECATLAGGVEWFLDIIDYTSGITVRSDPGPGGPRAPASAADSTGGAQWL